MGLPLHYLALAIYGTYVTLEPWGKLRNMHPSKPLVLQYLGARLEFFSVVKNIFFIHYMSLKCIICSMTQTVCNPV